jgi:hypothetical protein
VRCKQRSKHVYALYPFLSQVVCVAPVPQVLGIETLAINPEYDSLQLRNAVLEAIRHAITTKKDTPHDDGAPVVGVLTAWFLRRACI